MTIQRFMKELKLLDIFRNLNQQTRAYSCYSATFQTFSRIYYFLISSELISKIENGLYDSIVISDHAPCLIYKDDKITRDPPRWRFHHKWLQDEDFVKYIGQQIDEFFQINTNQTSACVKWDAFKAFLRGHIISFTGRKSKKARIERLELETKIKNVQERVYQSDNKELKKELLLLRAEYNKHSSFRAASSLLRLKQSFYEQGDRAGKVLSWQIKQLEVTTTITSIIIQDETLIDPRDINTAFKDYYQKLYDAQENLDQNDLNKFLDRMNIPGIPNDAGTVQNAEINKDEIAQAIDGMNSGKQAGPDGIPIDLYKNALTRCVYRDI